MDIKPVISVLLLHGLVHPHPVTSMLAMCYRLTPALLFSLFFLIPVCQALRHKAQASLSDEAHPFHLPYSFPYESSCLAFRLPRTRKTLQASVHCAQGSPCSWTVLYVAAQPESSGQEPLYFFTAGLKLIASLLPQP